MKITRYGHIKTAEQQTIIQQYSDWYTGHWWVGPHPVPSSLYQM